MVYLFGLFISSSVSGCVLFGIMNALYEKKYPRQKICYGGALVTYIILSVLVAWYGMPGVNVLFSITILCALSYFFYKTQGKNMLINSIIIIIYFSIADLIVTIAFSLVTLESAYRKLQEPYFFLISGIGNALVMLCTCNLLVQLIKRCKINIISRRLHIYTIFLLIFQLGTISYSMESHQTASNNITLLILAVGFVVVDGGVLYLFKMFSQNAILEKQAELAEQQCDMTVKYYECLQSRYEETQKLIHDFKKHLQVLMSLDSSQDEVKKTYTSELLDSINRIQHNFKYEDVIVATIIEEKKQVCEYEGIELELNLQEIKFDFMVKSEVTSLFANLLDNAIEACRNSEKDKKEIRLRVHSFKNYIVIGMRNTIGGVPLFKDGNLQSTKPGHMGMGMLILSNLVNKYCGNIDFSYSEEYFETKIIIAALPDNKRVCREC